AAEAAAKAVQPTGSDQRNRRRVNDPRSSFLAGAGAGVAGAAVAGTGVAAVGGAAPGGGAPDAAAPGTELSLPSDMRTSCGLSLPLGSAKHGRWADSTGRRREVKRASPARRASSRVHLHGAAARAWRAASRTLRFGSESRRRSSTARVSGRRLAGAPAPARP